MKKRGAHKYRTPITIAIAVVAVIVATNLYLGSITPSGVQFPVSGETPTSISGEEPRFFTIIEKERMFARAPEIRGIAGYINTDESLTLQGLNIEDKVVLVDFWTYSCINCQRTIPYLNAWYEKYSDDGLVIVGVHSPEFQFEKDYNNVADAVEKFGIEYPVVQDNDFETWRAYDNRYWPRKYIVDIDGFVRYDHIGEGAYDQTELVIQDLLAERAHRLNLTTDMDRNISSPSDAEDVDFVQINTPEIYFGYNFLIGRNYLGNYNSASVEKTYDFVIPDSQSWRDNFAYIGGSWYGSGDYMELTDGVGNIGLIFNAKKANIVAGGTGTVSVKVDGEKTGDIEIDGSRLYNLASSDSYGRHVLELEIVGDVQLYTFTFG